MTQHTAMHKIDHDMAILIVDDFKTAAIGLKKILTDSKFSNIHIAHDGMDAWRILKEQSIDFVISDWHMKNSGIVLLSKIRASIRLNHLPVLIISAEADKSQFEAITQTHTKTDFASKPVDRASLLKKIQQLL